MKSVEFCYWLQGLFELGNPTSLNAAQTDLVKRHLAMVFKHEIDPSYGKPEAQAAKAAHFVDVIVRINGQDERHQVDWLKHMKRVTELADVEQLMKFYAAASLHELVDRQARHIEKLQAQLPPTGGPAFQRVREG